MYLRYFFEFNFFKRHTEINPFSANFSFIPLENFGKPSFSGVFWKYKM